MVLDDGGDASRTVYAKPIRHRDVPETWGKCEMAAEVATDFGDRLGRAVVGKKNRH
jgi:hypothetical protein